MHQRCLAILALMCCEFALFSRADVVVLKDGRQLQGFVNEEGGEQIQIKTEQTDLWISRAQVESIRKESPSEYYLRLGNEELQRKEVQKAREHFALALESNPANGAASKQLNLLGIKAQTEQQLREKQRDESASDALVKQARALLDRELVEEAFGAAQQALEKNPRSVPALELATQTSLKLWSNNRAPEALLSRYAKQLQEVDPANKSLANALEIKRITAQRQGMTLEASRKQLYQEIMQSYQKKVLDYRLLNKVDRFLEMQPDPAMKARVEQIKIALQKASIGGVSISTASVLHPAKTPTPTPAPVMAAVTPPSYYNLNKVYGK